MKNNIFIRAILVAAAVSTLPAMAKTFLVNTTADEEAAGGACSLYEAALSATQDDQSTDWGCGIRDANPSVVKVPAGTYDMTDILHNILATRTVEIAGAGMTKTFIITRAEEGLFLSNRDRSITVNIHDLTLDGGFTDDQVGIYLDAFQNADGIRTLGLTLKNVQISDYTESGIENDHGKIDMDHCVVAGNSGSGIVNRGLASSGGGNLTIKYSLIYNNTTENGGGGIVNTGNLTMENCTVSNNSTFPDFNPGIGGGILIGSPEDGSGNTNTSFNHVTFAENWATDGGGGVAVDPGARATVKTSNSIFASNAVSTGAPDFSGPTGSNASGMGPNLFGDITGATQLKSGTGDLKNVDALLNELDDYGGKTQTYALRPGSPAIDKANGSLTTDQRDYFRPTDGDGNGTATRDLGAYEHDPNSQTETARLIAKSSDTHATFSNSTYSAGRGTRLEANASGDFVTYAIPVRDAGTYSVSVRIEKGTNRGKFQAAFLDDNTGTFVNLGTAKDGYASSSSLSSQTLGTVSYDFAGMKQFRFKVTGKNSSSSGYRIYFDYIKLSPL
jgi:hypothetical protein